MSDVRLWSDTRTAEEIGSNYLTRLTGTEAGLVSYWPLDERLGASFADAANANGNMSARGDWTWRWNGENRLVGIDVGEVPIANVHPSAIWAAWQWCSENRSAAPSLFVSELVRASDLIADQPGVGHLLLDDHLSMCGAFTCQGFHYGLY